MFEVGQKVWCAMLGEGEVIKINNTDTMYPVVVSFGGVVESYTLTGKYQTYAVQTLFPYPVEIIKKVTKPSIDWEHVRAEYKYLAQDASGNAYLYLEKPVLVSNGWQATQGDCTEAQQFASYTTGTCDWQYSLIARPKDS